jgi:carboxyl-terminal processing protease
MDQVPVPEESYDARPARDGLPIWLKVVWGVGLAIVVFLSGMTAGILMERQQYADDVRLDGSWQELADVITLLEDDSYYRPDDAEQAAEWQDNLERRAIDALLEESGDGYAAFLPPQEAAESSARLTGEYEGIGVSIGANHEGEIEIVSVMLGSPADRADVRVGDVVDAVEATPIPGGDIELASTLLRGDAGTDVSIRFDRPGAESYGVTLTRERISTGDKTVAYRYLDGERIAIVQISLFALTTSDELDQALAQAREDGAERLVLDLRGNPGGWVSEARKVIGRFVDADAGPALLEDTWPAGGRMVELPIDGDGAERFEGEMIVLIDGHTASAAEIVASALQHYERATIVGEQSFGKGSVQRVYDFDSGESLRLTVAEWFTPDGQRLQEVGVTPDVEMPVERPALELVPELTPIFAGLPPEVPAATPAA